MKSYYDLLVNLNDELYEFYEWSKDDVIIHVKSIPIIRIDNKLMIKILNNKIRINEELLNLIKGKVKGYKEIDFKNGILFTDVFTSVVVEFNDEGYETSISKLLVEDDLNVIEIGYALDISDIDIKLVSKRFKHLLRQDEKIKRYLKIEYNNLYKDKCYDKLNYLFYERFSMKNNDIDSVYNLLLSDLDNIKDIHYNLYKIIINTYKNRTLKLTF